MHAIFSSSGNIYSFKLVDNFMILSTLIFFEKPQQQQQQDWTSTHLFFRDNNTYKGIFTKPKLNKLNCKIVKWARNCYLSNIIQIQNQMNSPH